MFEILALQCLLVNGGLIAGVAFNITVSYLKYSGHDTEENIFPNQMILLHSNKLANTNHQKESNCCLWSYELLNVVAG